MNRKTIISSLAKLLVALLIMAAPAAMQAQFDYMTNVDNTVTITGYTGPPWAVTIPTNINGLTVTSIGAGALDNIRNLTSVIIPNSITTIGDSAFSNCDSLTNVSIPNSVTNIGASAFEFCTSLTTIKTPNSVPIISEDAFSGCTSLTSVTMLDGPTAISEDAFERCTNLTSVTIPSSVTNIESGAFSDCNILTSVFFTGNAPIAHSSVFVGDNSNPAIYYLPGTTGWSSPFALLQALLWNPQLQTSSISNNQFGFNVTGTTNIPVVVEGCTNLVNPVWTSLQTITLTNGSVYFTDAQ